MWNLKCNPKTLKQLKVCTSLFNWKTSINFLSANLFTSSTWENKYANLYQYLWCLFWMKPCRQDKHHWPMTDGVTRQKIHWLYYNYMCGWGGRLQTVLTVISLLGREVGGCEFCLPESSAKRCRTEGKAFGWLVCAGCAHTHTAHWAYCYYANRVITHALPIQQTPPLLALINRHVPRLCNTSNKQHAHIWIGKLIDFTYKPQISQLRHLIQKQTEGYMVVRDVILLKQRLSHVLNI